MIRLSDPQRGAIAKHGAAEFPLECCGVLLGDVEEDVKIVREVRPLQNTFEPSQEFERSIGVSGDGDASAVGQERRFMVSPTAMFELMREERRTKRKVLGFYHSHPNHPARPSEYDRVWAMPWYSYAIVSIVNGEPGDMTFWTLSEDGSRFDPEPLRTP